MFSLSNKREKNVFSAIFCGAKNTGKRDFNIR
jgi:hypothetical protein